MSCRVITSVRPSSENQSGAVFSENSPMRRIFKESSLFTESADACSIANAPEDMHMQIPKIKIFFIRIDYCFFVAAHCPAPPSLYGMRMSVLLPAKVGI